MFPVNPRPSPVANVLCGNKNSNYPLKAANDFNGVMFQCAGKLASLYTAEWPNALIRRYRHNGVYRLVFVLIQVCAV